MLTQILKPSEIYMVHTILIHMKITAQLKKFLPTPNVHHLQICTILCTND